jgi:hypothetical protein
VWVILLVMTQAFERFTSKKVTSSAHHVLCFFRGASSRFLESSA